MADSTVTLTVEELKQLIKPFPIVYFCAEFAVDDKLPIFAGGLGVLAGDVLYQASEEGQPYVGVGLLYDKGYMHQEISKDANMMAEEVIDYDKAGLKLLVHEGNPVTIEIPVHGERAFAVCYVRMVGNCPLLLLSTKTDKNGPHEASITDRLYFGDREHRFEQEMILGFGGYRLLKSLDIKPRLYHLNEGHSALFFYELAKERLDKYPGMHFADAMRDIGNVVFTNHTLVPAGNDVFSQDLAYTFLSPYAEEFPIGVNELVAYGIIEDTSLFSPTVLALRCATVSQAVSQLHAKKALEIWSHHPMIPVTNGVRQAYWQTPEISEGLNGGPGELWEGHLKRKRLLIQYIKQTTQMEWQESDLILGWSRRIARYKRPLTLFEDLDRLQNILQKSPVPVRVVISGKPHMNDEVGLRNLQTILEVVGRMGGHVVYLQNYSLSLAKLMLSGIDLLVNSPVRGFEACGTSGMKASLNGVLSATTLDGWTDEVSWEGKGWTLDSERTGSDLYAKLERSIIPIFVKKDEAGIPTEWVERMRATIELVTAHYTLKRMFEELREKVYIHVRADNPPLKKKT